MNNTPRLTPEQVRAVHEAVCAAVCERFRVSRRGLFFGRRRGPNGPVLARQVAMYLTNLSGVSQKRIGALFHGRALSTVHYACAAVEDARDNQEFDALLDEIEGVVRNVTEEAGSMKAVVTRAMVDAGLKALTAAPDTNGDIRLAAIFNEDCAREALIAIYRAMEDASNGPGSRTRAP